MEKGQTAGRRVGTRLRRARRTDFVEVMRLLAEAGLAVPPPDRRSLRRFRHLVADLGTDIYISSVDGAFAGLLHLTYDRQLTTKARACIEMLVVAPRFRGCGVGRALLRLALDRAARRQCSRIDCRAGGEDAAAVAMLSAAGFVSSGTVWSTVAGMPVSSKGA